MDNQIEADLIDSLFAGASGDSWIGDPCFLGTIPDFLKGDYLPAVFGGVKILFSFHQYFIYGGDLDIYSYTNMLLQTADGNTFAPALNHRFLGVVHVDHAKHEVIGQSVKCAASSLLGLGDDSQFPAVAGAAVLRFQSANPEIKQYFFFGDDMAKAISKIDPVLQSDGNTTLGFTMLSGLVAPCYGFELTEKHA